MMLKSVKNSKMEISLDDHMIVQYHILKTYFKHRGQRTLKIKDKGSFEIFNTFGQNGDLIKLAATTCYNSEE